MKKAFKETADYVFEKNINPLIINLEMVSYRIMDHAEEQMEELITKLKSETKDLIAFIAETTKKTVNDMVTHAIDEIKKKILDTVFDRVDKLRSDVMKDINNILNKVS